MVLMDKPALEEKNVFMNTKIQLKNPAHELVESQSGSGQALVMHLGCPSSTSR